MTIAYVAVTVLAALMTGYSAVAAFTRAKWVADNLDAYGVPRSWWPWLGTAKAAGAVGLLIGLIVPAIGELAAVGLVLYFIGAIITVVRARWYSHIPYPFIYMALAAGSLTLGVAA